MPPSYNSREYWNKRFAKETSFDWLLPTSAVQSVIREQLETFPYGKYSEILHIGCGNSDLSHELVSIGEAYFNITNVDFSETLIESAKRKANGPKAVPYLLKTKYGTDPANFDDYLTSIGKTNEGLIERDPDVPWQVQVMDLFPEEAKHAEAQTFMDFVVLTTEPMPVDEKGRTIPGHTQREIRAKAPRPEQVRWIAADLLSFDDVKAKLLLPPVEGEASENEASEMGSGRYDFIIDKSTTDSIACGEDTSITLPYPPCDHHTAQQLTQASIHPIHILALHLALLAPRQGSRWLVFSYSEHRFPFLEDDSKLYANLADGPLPPKIVEAGFPDTGKLWRMEGKWSIETSRNEGREEDSGKGKEACEGRQEMVYRPPELCWVYVLVRTDIAARPQVEQPGQRRRSSVRECMCL